MNTLYNNIKKNKLFKLADIIFIFLLVAIILLFYFIALPVKSGTYAEIYSDGKLIKEMPLNTDAQYTYIYNQDEYNIITVKDGKISVTDSNCKDKICQNFAPTDKAGSTIICLPHKLFIIIKGEEDVDAILAGEIKYD